ncbi:MAG: enoyl-CoA hydratase-related protein [Candidatus Competibacterales bacterium]|nr:enoyl-CoA hydratase-related protein [Candidatus Competibacterales bacterium]
MHYQTLLFEIEEGVARITLDRPEAANAVNLTVARELLDAALRCQREPAVRAVLLTGQGRLFCAGGDLRDFAAAGDGVGALLEEITTYLHAAVARFVRLDAPLVVAVNGTAGGGGMSLVMAADLVLAAESARFTMAYTAAGLTPDAGTSFFLPRLVGWRRAQELIFTNRRLSAAEALDWGLVTRVVPDEQLADEALAQARCLAAGPSAAYGAAKRLLARSAGNSLEAQLELEARAIATAAASADGREGVRAFLDKRSPRFSGR